MLLEDKLLHINILEKYIVDKGFYMVSKMNNPFSWRRQISMTKFRCTYV